MNTILRFQDFKILRLKIPSLFSTPVEILVKNHENSHFAPTELVDSVFIVFYKHITPNGV
jgi:hypothetical protein